MDDNAPGCHLVQMNDNASWFFLVISLTLPAVVHTLRMGLGHLVQWVAWLEPGASPLWVCHSRTGKERCKDCEGF